MKALSTIANALLVAGTLASGAAHAADAAKNPSGQVYASPSQVRLVQEKLREQGRKPGSPGVWDEATIAEVRDYQKANGLAPTGEFDTSLLSALKVGDVLGGDTSSTFLDGLLRAEPTKSAAAIAAARRSSSAPCTSRRSST